MLPLVPFYGSSDTITQEQKVTKKKKQIEEEEESPNWVSRAAIRENQGNFITNKGINEIKAELTDDRRSQLVESNYWDESHSWGSDSEIESDDYWHFLGRYE